VATSELVVLHHGRERGGVGGDEARPSASTACWAAQYRGRVDFTSCLASAAFGRPELVLQKLDLDEIEST
jgi:hypothetical protein